ncbi:MAG: hypothetical protein ACREKH_10275, partial [Candidatus Rokuibacteriota bacterium]
VLPVPPTADILDPVSRPGFGGWRLRAIGNSGTHVRIDNAESWRIPGRFATVGAGDVVTMSGNFIQ